MGLELRRGFLVAAVLSQLREARGLLTSRWILEDRRPRRYYRISGRNSRGHLPEKNRADVEAESRSLAKDAGDLRGRGSRWSQVVSIYFLAAVLAVENNFPSFPSCCEGP